MEAPWPHFSAAAALVLTAGLAACSGSEFRRTARLRSPRATWHASRCRTFPRARIVYAQTRADGTDAVFLMKLDGNDLRCLVDTAGPDSFPAGLSMVDGWRSSAARSRPIDRRPKVGMKCLLR